MYFLWSGVKGLNLCVFFLLLSSIVLLKWSSNAFMCCCLLFPQTPESLAAWLRRTRCLMASPRAVDTLSAALVLQLLIDKCSLPLRFHGNPFDVTSGEGEENEAQKAELLDEEFSKLDLTNFPCCQAFWMLCNLVSVLESHGAVAKENLSAAALRAPMHGILFCQRSLLARLPLK